MSVKEETSQLIKKVEKDYPDWKYACDLAVNNEVYQIIVSLHTFNYDKEKLYECLEYADLRQVAVTFHGLSMPSEIVN